MGRTWGHSDFDLWPPKPNPFIVESKDVCAKCEGVAEILRSQEWDGQTTRTHNAYGQSGLRFPQNIVGLTFDKYIFVTHARIHTHKHAHRL